MSEFNGVYRGAVHDINDPDLRGRLRCLVPAVLGDTPSGWAEPLLPTSVAPFWNVGDRVWVLFEGGDPNKPVYMARLEIHTGDIAPGAITRETLAATAITTDLLTATDAFVKALETVDLTSVTVTGLTFQTDSEPDTGIKIDKDGIRAYGPGGGAPFLNVDPTAGLAIVAGLVKADSFTASPPPGNKTSLGGTTEISAGGSVKLTGTTSAPASAPVLGYGYHTLQHSLGTDWPSRYGWSTDGTYRYTVRRHTYPVSIMSWADSFVVEKWNTSGNLVASEEIYTPDPSGTGVNLVHGSVVVGTAIYILVRLGATGKFRMYRVSLSAIGTNTATALTFSFPDTDLEASTRIVALGYDTASSAFLVAHSRAADNKVRVRRWTFSDGLYPSGDTPMVPGATLTTSFTVSGDLATILYGTFDFGANRYVVSTRSNNNFRPFLTDGSEPAGEQWPPGTTTKVGLIYSGGAFSSIDQTGRMRTYTGITSTSTSVMTKWVSSTFATATGETDQSPRASIVLPKRSGLYISTSAIPPGADRVFVYVGQGATDPGRTQMAQQPPWGVGVTSSGVLDTLTPPPGTNPPLTNTINSGLSTSILDKADNVIVDSDGVFWNGSLGAGTLRDAVDARVVLQVPATWSTYTPTWTAVTTNPSLNDGTVTGRYRLAGKTVDFNIQLTIGTATTFGSGAWRFSLPVTARGTNSSGSIQSQARLPGNLIRFALFVDANTINLVDVAGATVTGTTVSWVSGNVLSITGRYETA